MDAMIDVVEETPRQRWRRRAIKAAMHLAWMSVVYALLVVAARTFHRRVLYQPPAPTPETAAATKAPEGTTLLTLHAADGTPVTALELAAPKATRTIVHFHGNAETVDENLTLARMMHKRGFAVVLVEYRGYGRSRSPDKAATTPTEQGLYADATAVLDELASRGIGPERIVLWGQALGAGVAAEMAKRGRGARMILVAPLTSTVDLAQRVVPLLPASWVMVDRFDTLAKAPSIATPTLVVHGDIDDVIPVEFGERISQALPHATFLKISEGRHDNLYKNASVVTAVVAHAGG